jgi:hypothetical protein
MAWNSPKSFCIGVPDNMTRLRVSRDLNTAAVLLFADFNLCPKAKYVCEGFPEGFTFQYMPSSHTINPMGELSEDYIRYN